MMVEMSIEQHWEEMSFKISYIAVAYSHACEYSQFDKHLAEIQCKPFVNQYNSPNYSQFVIFREFLSGNKLDDLIVCLVRTIFPKRYDSKIEYR